MNGIGRLNASMEIIPIQGSGGRNDARLQQNFRHKQKPYFVDHLIVPRVKQYLEDNKTCAHVDMDVMVDDLQRKYREYSRRKRNAFKQSVDKALKTVLTQYGGPSNVYRGDDVEQSESSDEMYSEDISLENSNNSGQVAGQIMNMYMNRPGLSVTRGPKPPRGRGLHPLTSQHTALHGQHLQGARTFVRTPYIKQEPFEPHQRGYAPPRRGESSGGDKELINISSDEDDAGEEQGPGLEKGSVANRPSSSGLLPTPPSLLGSGPPGARGADSTAPTLNQPGDPARGRAPLSGPPLPLGSRAPPLGAPAGGGSGGGGGGSSSSSAEPSIMRPWPAIGPSASSTPRQAKRPRPPGPPAAASSSMGAPGAAVGAASSSAGAGRDSPATKRRREMYGGYGASQLSVVAQESAVAFADLGGVDDVLEEMARLLAHLRRPEIFRTLGVPPPRGVLLHGPPGCGKSLLARAVAGELQLPLLRVAGPELVAGVSGESEARVRELFEQAVQSAPCILFLDEVDALAPPRTGAQREMERRIVAQLLSCLDELGRPGPDAYLPAGAGDVLVLGATSRPEALDPALRRAGRFDHEVRLGIPDVRAREAILQVLCRSIRLAAGVDLRVLAKRTPGFVGADLQALTREAALAAVSRVMDEEEQRTADAAKDNEKRRTIKQDSQREAKTKDEPKTSSQENKDTKKEADKEAKSEDKKEDKDSNKKADEAKKDEKGDSEKVVKEPVKDEPTENMEVIDISDRDTPSESDPSKNPSAKPDSSVTKIDVIEEDEVCIEAEVTSSDTAKNKGSKSASPPGADEDMEVLDELDDDDDDDEEEEVVPVPVRNPTRLKPAMGNVWCTQLPSLTDEQLKNMYITQTDFETALKNVQPSAKREGFATVPDTSWDDVGALRDVREELQMAILAPVRHPEAFESLGLTAPAGLLLCGPPGCGKTLIAKAIANEADINFISVKGPELLNMYVGESEKAVRQCFLRARNSAPCVIFFDELDALCPRRVGGPAGEGNSATQRVVNQLLTEMDGVEGRRGVFLLAASNRPDILDPAVLRPGRLDRVVYVGLPGPEARADILRALTKNGTRPKLASDVDLQTLGESADLDGCSGADLAALIREAATLALRQHLVGAASNPSNSAQSPPCVAQVHLDQAIKRLRPSVPPQERIRYEKLRIQFSAPGAITQFSKKSPQSATSDTTSSQTPTAGTGKRTNETDCNQGEPVAAPEPTTSTDTSATA